MSIYSGMTPRGILIMAFASIGALLFGLDNGWWGTVLGETAFLCHYGDETTVDGVTACTLSTSRQSAGSGIGSAGIMLGCALAVYVNKVFGRKRSLAFLSMLSIIGIVIEMTSALGSSPAGRFGQFIAGKLINSMAMGMACNIIPIYLSETSTASARGSVINMYNLVQITGVIVASASVYAVSTRTDRSAYLIPMGIQLVSPGLILIVYYWLPESPRWLIWVGHQAEAVESAKALFLTESNNFDADEYCSKIAIAFEDEKRFDTGWRDVIRGADLRRTLIATGAQCFQQAQGSSYMTTYIVSFLVGIGVTNYFPVIMGLYMELWVVTVAGSYLPDRFGRRPNIIFPAAINAASLIIVAILTTVYTDPSPAVQKASLALIFIWYSFFGIQGNQAWIISAEVAPTRNREKVLFISSFSGFGVSLIITWVAPYIQDVGYGNLGSKIGFIWGSFSILTVIATYLFLPETRGFSLEQLDYLFENRVPARKFDGYHFDDDILATAPIGNVVLAAGAADEAETEMEAKTKEEA
ncbi:hypothetical protein EHS25_005755 [Saitozyma podzolica]|uniref:Major facilitator superfamily (MFS) profile domain-containing protein n=1 Tax=Saitozyma podzolica TaxID=1890683 RepID=A0A427XWE5_9TREE|nr:hypothetical protein EHS25_005755 [Saitozyma podzolica]